MSRFNELLVGSDRGFGLLLLPMFLMAALLGATLAGALAILYYGQQVSRLEAETSDARAQVQQARDEVLEAAEEARRSIEQQVEEVRQALADDPPIPGPEEAGVYAVVAQHANGERRVGSGFTVASSNTETIVVTTYRVVATEDGFAVPSVDVLLPGRNATARVHNFDRELDVATLVMTAGTVPVTEWRPVDEDLRRGDRLWLAGIAGPGSAAVLQGSVGSVAPQAVVPSIPANDFLAGGPLIDAVGRVVAIATLNYAPFGRVAGELVYGVPIRMLCRELIQCTEADRGAEQLRGAGGRGEMAHPPREPNPPLPSPAPQPAP
ncbi:MAG TPA: trypsin-like peptidase domain-containing protein, partial [Egibacteraceae bacterium]|nr:trypsin-like peptidase domain-containing protein [Egibacteraceae bacterium]